MADSQKDYSALDTPAVLGVLFHPRPEHASENPESGSYRDYLIPVAKGVEIGARFHLADPAGVHILFFHGNGEIVADYDDLGAIFQDLGFSFLAVDYRGYGRSSGLPSTTAMMADCHVLFQWVRDWMRRENRTGPLVVMGRSLGSASALELIHHYPDDIDGLIIESGFAHVRPLLALFGLNPDALGITDPFDHPGKISSYSKPTLIIHAEKDHLIAFGDAEDLFEASGSPKKRLVKIEGANHNNILAMGIKPYFQAIHELGQKIQGPR